MTAPAPAAASPRPVPSHAAPPPPTAAPATHAAPRRRPGRSLRGGDTPAVLRLLMIGLIIGSLLWGVIAALTAAQHSSAAGEVVATSEPLSLDAQQMYQALSDADVTATSAFLAGPPAGKPEALGVRLHYLADIHKAGVELAALRSAGGAAQGSQLAANLAAISSGLPIYTGYVQQAQTYAALGYPLTGGSFIQVASEEMHLVLLPAANSIYQSEIAALHSASAQATGLPLIVIAVLLAIGIGYVLVRTQRWLTRRTHRRVNNGLLLASAAVVVATLWLIVSFIAARADFGNGLGHGSTPAESLAQAAIAAQQGRGDQVLNLISRSGSTSFQADFLTEQGRIGPGSGSLLSSAAAQSSSPTIAAAEQDAKAWYAASAKVFALNLASNYAQETSLVIGSQPGSSSADFGKLEADLRTAIAADQVVFHSGAVSGSDAFGGLELVVIIAALIMAAGSAWGLSRRLAEYR
jgi:hypothetical protein